MVEPQGQQNERGGEGQRSKENFLLPAVLTKKWKIWLQNHSALSYLHVLCTDLGHFKFTSYVPSGKNNDINESEVSYMSL